ncbi:SpoIIE family protein phosphatase [Micromonospora siamensis]|uniref:Serine phosphatase RsbU, regulator of sigma subunit n=1 Tax=Micromonospora siamensis TaxID=299152 RepID=A0A1C5IX48_9ACTN|nr:SpoIIE family protein phosphatase [Micromonospora siamensis]SCG62912.1 Serine phosphatase RsbU, regulator of sigma subunit [Micromonospora siamensis]
MSGRHGTETSVAEAESLRRRVAMLRAACATALSADELIAIAIAQARSATGADGAVLFLADDDDLVIAAGEGYPPDLAPLGARFPIAGETPAGLAARNRQSVWVTDEGVRDSCFPSVRRERTGYSSLVALPLVAHDRVLGVLGISFRAPRECSGVEQLYLLVLADQVAVTLDRLQGHDAGPAGVIDNRLVHDPVRRETVRELLAALVDAGDTVDRLTALAADLCGAPSAQVSLIGAEQTVAGTAGGAPEAGTVGPAADSLCTVTMSLRAPLVVTDATGDTRVSTLPPVRSGAVGAYLGVPLSVDGTLVGALCVYDDQPHDWPARGREILEALAASVGTELRLRRLATRDAQTIRLARDRQDLTDRLAAAASAQQVGAVLADACAALDGVVAAVVVRHDTDGGGQHLGARGVDPDSRAALLDLAVRLGPGTTANRVWGLTELVDRFAPDAARLVCSGTRQVAVVPLRGQLATASLVAALDGAADLTAAWSRLTELAPLATAVLDRAVAHEQNHTARARADLLTYASAELASSLDVDEILQRLARLVVPSLADGCLVHLQDQRALRLVAASHVDARAELTMPAVLGAHPELLQLVGACLAGGPRAGALAHPTLALDRLRIVPLLAQGHPIGALTLVEPPAGGRPRLLDDGLLDELAVRAAVAVDNARLYAKRSADVQALQYRLLPSRLPDVPGFDLAACYAPGERSLDVGGDFYDVVPLAEDHLVLVVGDVCGRGAGAAAITGHARSVLRTVVQDGASPAQALHRLNSALRMTWDNGEFCTAVVAEIRAAGDGRHSRLRVACGGHPRPLLRHDGVASEIGRGGPMLGMLADPVFPETELLLDPDDVVLLFTDGITEARRGDELFGVDRLAAVLAKAPGPADLVLDTVHRTVEGFHDHEGDDIAMLAVRPRGRVLDRLDIADAADDAQRRAADRWLDALPTVGPGRDALRQRLTTALTDLTGPVRLTALTVGDNHRVEVTRQLAPAGPPSARRPTGNAPAAGPLRPGAPTLTWVEAPR